MTTSYDTKLTYQPSEKVSIKTHTVKIALLKVQPTDEFYYKLIGWWTKSKYIHAELIIDDNWITSNPETGFSIKTLGRVKLTSKHMDILANWIDGIKGTKYDYLGILMSQFLPLSIDNRHKYFCSEVVTRILQIIGYEEVLDLLPQNVSPADLAEIYGLER